jgi:hypothetical protein
LIGMALHQIASDVETALEAVSTNTPESKIAVASSRSRRLF